MYIENGYIFTETAQFVKRDITIGGQYIIDGTPGDTIIDATDLYIIPGLVDTHLHGCMGVDFSNTNADGIKKALKYQAENGITSVCPTAVSSSPDKMENICKLAAEFEPENEESSIVGVHLEGPFLSSSQAGAQRSSFFIEPDTNLVKRFIQYSDELVYIMTFAPELDGSSTFIKEISLLEEDIILSIGHTSADYDTALKALQSGAKRVTHLFNAMASLSPKNPGIIGAAFDCEDVFVEIVVNHIHQSLVRACISMFGEDRVVFVSDSLSATGMPAGNYPFGDSLFNFDGAIAKLSTNTDILGSTHNLMDCLKIAVNEMDISLETAVRLSSMNPAISIGRFSEIGSITPGKYADLILIDEELNIKAIILKGEMILNNL